MAEWKRRYSLPIKILASIFVGMAIWLLPLPDGLNPEAWKLFAIFTATIVAIILKPLPMGAVALIALTASVLLGALRLEDACNGFGNDVVWLVVFAFFIAKGFITTGLGSRLAYSVMGCFGKSSLGLGYGLVAADLLLSPCIPSITARAGGVVYPVLKSLADIFTGESHDPKMASYLTLCAYQGTAVTSAMFMTAMAGNPLIASIAESHGITIGWMDWALAAIVPGLVSLLILPCLIFWLNTPSIRHTPHAKEMAGRRLSAMGPVSRREMIMALTFILLILLWIFGHFFGVKATTAAMIGVAILLLTRILEWKDILQEHSAWDTLIWFATLITLACRLNTTGFSGWFSEAVAQYAQGLHWGWGILLLGLIYYYSHYFFASAVAHISSMFAPFLLVAIAIGTPPVLAALILAYFSNLFMGLTHYGSGAAPILFGTGYVSVGQWWKAGAIASVLFVFVWIVIGGFWWKFLGYW